MYFVDFEYFKYGKRHNYWLKGAGQLFTEKKYENLKEELLNNGVYPLTEEIFNILMSKSAHFVNADSVKQIVANNEHVDDWKIKEGQCLQTSHLVAMLVLTNIPGAYDAFRVAMCGDMDDEQVEFSTLSDDGDMFQYT